MTKTYFAFGAQLILTLKGAADELEIFINRLVNFGAMSSDALDDYKEGVDTVAKFNVTRTHFERALKGWSEFELIMEQSKLPRESRLRGEAFDTVAKARAEAKRAEFTWNTDKADAAKREDVREYVIPRKEDSEWLRRTGKKILAALSKSRRASATKS